MNSRRYFLGAMATAGLALALASGSALAAPPSVEILAMQHPPVKAALAPLRSWLATQSGKLKVTELDIESPQGEKRLGAVGLSGHIPIVILIDGKYRQQRKDGSKVEFVNFPSIKEAPPGVRGEWTTADVQAVLTERFK